MNLKRALFNLYFYIVPKAATKWLNFKLDIAEALDTLERDESGELSPFEIVIIFLAAITLFVICATIYLTERVTR